MSLPMSAPVEASGSPAAQAREITSHGSPSISATIPDRARRRQVGGTGWVGRRVEARRGVVGADDRPRRRAPDQVAMAPTAGDGGLRQPAEVPGGPRIEAGWDPAEGGGAAQRTPEAPRDQGRIDGDVDGGPAAGIGNRHVRRGRGGRNGAGVRGVGRGIPPGAEGVGAAGGRHLGERCPVFRARRRRGGRDRETSVRRGTSAAPHRGTSERARAQAWTPRRESRRARSRFPSASRIDFEISRLLAKSVGADIDPRAYDQIPARADRVRQASAGRRLGQRTDGRCHGQRCHLGAVEPRCRVTRPPWIHRENRTTRERCESTDVRDVPLLGGVVRVEHQERGRRGTSIACEGCEEHIHARTVGSLVALGHGREPTLGARTRDRHIVGTRHAGQRRRDRGKGRGPGRRRGAADSPRLGQRPQARRAAASALPATPTAAATARPDDRSRP